MKVLREGKELLGIFLCDLKLKSCHSLKFSISPIQKLLNDLVDSLTGIGF